MLSQKFLLDKNRITNQISILLHFLVTGIQLLYADLENPQKFGWEILFLSRQTFHAKLLFVLSSSMNLDPSGSWFDLAAQIS